MKRKRNTSGICLASAMLVICGCLLLGKTGVEAKKTVDVDGIYHAALGLQTEESRNNGRIHRRAYYTNEYYGKEEWNHLAIGTYGDENTYERLVGKFKDVTIKGNGVYTVSLKNADFRDARQFQLLQVATDIPNTGKIKFSDMKVEINGEVVASVSSPVLDKRDIAKKRACLQVVNTEISGLNVMDRNLLPSGKGNTIKITFQVKGFSYKKGENPPQRTTPSPSPKVSPSPSPRTSATPTPQVSLTPTKSAAPKKNSAVKGAEGKNKAKDKTVQEDIVPDEYETSVIVIIIILSVISIIGITVAVNQRRR